MSGLVVIDSGEAPKKNRRLWLWIPLCIVLIIAIAVVGFVFWALNPTVQIDAVALNALASSDNITVAETTWISFLPHEPPTTGFIFYPGARVPAEAYAPLARGIAEAGYLVVIVYPPLNLAILNTDLAVPVMEHFSAVEHWVVGGHSLGGSAAAIFAQNNLDIVDGLVLMGLVPHNNSLRDSNLAILLLYGSNDGLLSLEEVDASHANLPDGTRYVEIEGGNHAQFGYYGEQRGDNPANIRTAEQVAQAVNAVVDLLAAASNR